MFKIIAPASTANLGPAFDTAGCALNLSLELSVKIIDGEAHGSRVKMELVDSNGASINDPDVPLDHRNLILKSAYYFQQRITHGKSPQQSAKECAELSGIEGLFHGVSSDKCVQIKCMNRIPLSRGLVRKNIL